MTKMKKGCLVKATENSTRWVREGLKDGDVLICIGEGSRPIFKRLKDGRIFRSILIEADGKGLSSKIPYVIPL